MSKWLLYNKISSLNKEIFQISGSKLCAAGNTFLTEQQQNILFSTKMKFYSAVDKWDLGLICLGLLDFCLFWGGVALLCFVCFSGHVDTKASISFNTLGQEEQTHGKSNSTKPRQASLTMVLCPHAEAVLRAAIINQSKSVMNKMKLIYESFTRLTLIGNLLIQQKYRAVASQWEDPTSWSGKGLTGFPPQQTVHLLPFHFSVLWNFLSGLIIKG